MRYECWGMRGTTGRSQGRLFYAAVRFSWGSDVDTVCRVAAMLACFSRDRDTGTFFRLTMTRRQGSESML